MIRKVLVIPYVKCIGLQTRFLVAKDARTKEWTLLSGTCEPYEHVVTCALRELCEETKGLVRFRKLPKQTHRMRFIDGQKRVDVFFIPLKWKKERVQKLVRDFENMRDKLPKEYLENSLIRFETCGQFLRHPRMWSYIRRSMHFVIGPIMQAMARSTQYTCTHYFRNILKHLQN